jgi:hypothetical protein
MGGKFLQSIAELETKCASFTAKEPPQLGVKEQGCYEALGMTLALRLRGSVLVGLCWR